jgi:outer membrane protein TolC
MASTRIKMTLFAAATAFVLAAAPVRCERFALRPEWSVGQSEMGAADLAPTPPPPPPDQLALREAIEVAFKHNLRFRQTIQSLLDSDSELRVAERRWALTVGADIESTHNSGSDTEIYANGGFTWSALSGAEFSATAALTALEQRQYSVAYAHPLGRGKGSVSPAYEALRQARSFYRQSLLSFYLEQQDLAERVVAAYFDGYNQGQLIAVEQNGLKLAEQALADARARRAEEENTIFDVTRAQFDFARAQRSVYRAQQAYGDSIDRLLGVLGLEIGGQPELVTKPIYDPQPIDSAVAVTTALANRAELPLFDLGLDDDRATVRIASDARRPRIDAVTSLSRFSNGGGTEWLIGLRSSLPIRSRRLEEAESIARRSLMVAEQGRHDLRLQIATEVRSVVRAAQAAKDNVDSARQNLDAAQVSLDAARIAVEEGERDNRDLIDAQGQLTTSEVLLSTAQIDYYLATVRLQRAIGANILEGLPTEAVPPAPAP